MSRPCLLRLLLRLLQLLRPRPTLRRSHRLAWRRRTPRQHPQLPPQRCLPLAAARRPHRRPPDVATPATPATLAVVEGPSAAAVVVVVTVAASIATAGPAVATARGASLVARRLQQVGLPHPAHRQVLASVPRLHSSPSNSPSSPSSPSSSNSSNRAGRRSAPAGVDHVVAATAVAVVALAVAAAAVVGPVMAVRREARSQVAKAASSRQPVVAKAPSKAAVAKARLPSHAVAAVVVAVVVAVAVADGVTSSSSSSSRECRVSDGNRRLCQRRCPGVS